MFMLPPILVGFPMKETSLEFECSELDCKLASDDDDWMIGRVDSDFVSNAIELETEP